MSPRAAILFIGAAGILCAGPGWSDESKAESAASKRLHTMKTMCEDIKRGSKVGSTVDRNSQPPTLKVIYRNESPGAVWFPVDTEPSFRPDPASRSVTIWLGYAEAVHGPYADRYVLPRMDKVDPGKDYVLEIAWPRLVDELLVPDIRVRLEIRLATVPLEPSGVRGQQPLEKYLAQSCVVHSP